MPRRENLIKFRKQWDAGGGEGGSKPIRPMLPGEWCPGKPCHWTEQTRFLKHKYQVARVLGMLHIMAGIAYLQFRVRETIGVFSHSRVLYAYQLLFFTIECISVFSAIIGLFEVWNVCKRNCINFKLIPNNLLASRRSTPRSKDVSPEYSNYPSVGIFIPCYNEDVNLVQDTVLGALRVDYPPELLSVYLCDDGKDYSKRSMISQLRKQYENVNYVTRPVHVHAKAGNLNYSLQKTESDLVVTLDADFIARPNLLQRLIPYYYVWSPVTEMYDFNETLAAVQVPQLFRNLSPYDSDPLDQRQTYFREVVLPGKDWFNASTVVGTTNLLSRAALKEANYFPYYSVTEDSAMSLKFHRLGYRTYYVNESLATGLATTSLTSNFDQRERWMKGDWQVFFSKEGPLFCEGLTLIQRIVYLNMALGRFLSILYLFLDVASVLLLTFKVSFLDVPNTLKFMSYFCPFHVSGAIVRLARNSGHEGLEKSESASAAFEVIFRFNCLKGLFVALWKSKSIKFNVTEKSTDTGKRNCADLPCGEIWSNIKKTSINFLWAAILLGSICYGIVGPLKLDASMATTSLDTASAKLYQHGKLVPFVMALGFTTSSLLPHLLVMYLCFVQYLSGWVLEDVIHGRCDQYAVHPTTGKRFVPRSFISVVNFAQMVLIFGSMTALLVFSLREKGVNFSLF